MRWRKQSTVRSNQIKIGLDKEGSSRAGDFQDDHTKIVIKNKGDAKWKIKPAQVAPKRDGEPAKERADFQVIQRPGAGQSMELWEIGEEDHSKFHKEDAVAERQVSEKRQRDKPDKRRGRRIAYNDIGNSERMNQWFAIITYYRQSTYVARILRCSTTMLLLGCEGHLK